MAHTIAKSFIYIVLYFCFVLLKYVNQIHALKGNCNTEPVPMKCATIMKSKGLIKSNIQIMKLVIDLNDILESLAPSFKEYEQLFLNPINNELIYFIKHRQTYYKHKNLLTILIDKKHEHDLWIQEHRIILTNRNNVTKTKSKIKNLLF